MSELQHPSGPSPALTGKAASEAVSPLGWRYVLASLRTSVAVSSLGHGTDVTARAVAACGPAGDQALSVDIRRHRVIMSLQSMAVAAVTSREIQMAREISRAMAEMGLRTVAVLSRSGTRSDQVLEIAVDALDIPSIRPFWKAVLGYEDEVGRSGPEDPLVDPLGQGPAVWFQQMWPARRERNRIHLDVSVPHDEAERRIQAALAAGGVLASESHAPAFWVLADAEGNEVCVTTWQGRDD